ncbi:hypothetical protein COV18_06160 [Candidatus Woesearchaeota archaeon CG10_big_fil_rev_8_21_14_0_10_37_12]|nr:MAG: hypothetical protein COV18_06160 [Candidatus Woesearchaeota archaeon CG10_big_fil_rev_8_21_14_0_10_37_12]
MDALEKRIVIDKITELQTLLQDIIQIDLVLIGEVQEIERQSRVITHKPLFFKKLVNIDLTKINAGALERIVQHSSRLADFESELIRKQYSVELVVGFKQTAEDQSFLEHFRRELGRLISSIKAVKTHGQDILDIPSIYDKETHSQLTPAEQAEWKECIVALQDNLNSIHEFCSEVQQYSDYIKTRVEQISYLDAHTIIKKQAYKEFYNSLSNTRVRKKIIETEKKIEKWPEFSKKLHEPLKNCIAKGALGNLRVLHARIDMNLRILYVWHPETKTLIYHSILEHHDVDKISEIKY